jgi:hypothetical protein
MRLGGRWGSISGDAWVFGMVGGVFVGVDWLELFGFSMTEEIPDCSDIVL